MPDPRQEENEKAEKELLKEQRLRIKDAREREINRTSGESQRIWEAKRNIQQNNRKGWSAPSSQFENLDETKSINNQNYEENYNNPKNNKEKSKFEWEEFEFEENLNL